MFSLKSRTSVRLATLVGTKHILKRKFNTGCCVISAQFVISGKEEIQQAMQFLQQCDLIRIEDILPFFSDFVTIDHFREPICNSLQVTTTIYYFIQYST